MAILTHKNHLPHAVVVGYISPAPHKTGAGISSPLTNKAHNRASGFFTCDASPHLFRIMAGRMGPLSGGPVSLFAGRANPVRLATLSLAPLDGESLYSEQGFTSWLTANNAAPARTVSTRKPKSIVASIEPTRWHLSCHSTCCASHTAQCRYGCHQSWTTSLTISVRFRRCLTGRRTPRDFPENLTQKQHSASACWWGVRLSDIQEAL
ncbi:ash family protein [Salmonella enterica]|nr:ash family protein [Salmonella enterica subsp. enterica serovar Newport]EIT8740311.1 ash family protein [Salmonella enterica]EIR7959308.1 ash family protein [Salmonella enterica subsp. enterica serovar Newport]EIX8421712.1 ash family protein [Salmonella enterica]EIY8026464.1 ash family protein [Salmonella enterica subsp. enterica serovar Newport]